MVVEYFVDNSNEIHGGLSFAFLFCSICAVASAFIALLFKEETFEKHEYTTFSLKQFSGWEKRVIRDFAIAQFVIGFGAAITVPFYSKFFLNKFLTPPLVTA